MNIYNGWFDLKEGVSDMDFVEALEDYLGRLEEEGLIEGWRLMRRKLGLGPSHLGEFHLMIEVSGLAQLDEAFVQVAARRDPVEGLHFEVNRLVRNVTFALYRDFPDPMRERGEERF
jgi:hypothetical protein